MRHSHQSQLTSQSPLRSHLLTAVVLCIVMLALTSTAWAERKLGTIGPPPRKDPQRQSSSEAILPLPLPVAPMRRSEPKAEPAPPLFIGKLMYGSTQDYMPNPGDVDNLLRHVRKQIDSWYGWQLISLDELVQLHTANKPCEIPLLYITGYESFEWNAQQRAAMREYLLDGGTLLGDATLGSPAFTESFKREVAAMFPDRPFEMLQMDHPIYRGYYRYDNVSYFTIEQGTHTKLEGPPQMFGMNLAARTAIILSPYDMTCGWDEFYAPPAEAKVPGAPRTMAMMPADAIRMGINIVAYAAAQRRFGKAQSETRQILGQQEMSRAAMPIALLRHQGDWNADPNSLYQFIRQAAQRTSLPVEFDIKAVDPVLEQIADKPVLIMTGMDEPKLSAVELDTLRRHLQAGGFLFINNTSGFAKFDRATREMLAQLFPDQKLQEVPADHPLLKGLFTIEQMRDAGTLTERAAELEMISSGGRAIVVYSRNDTLGMLKGVHDPYANAYDAESSRKLALNILTYAVQR